LTCEQKSLSVDRSLWLFFILYLQLIRILPPATILPIPQISILKQPLKQVHAQFTLPISQFALMSQFRLSDTQGKEL